MYKRQDYVISDYSCIIYEAAVLCIPLFFYTYDYDTYIDTRDIYIDYPHEIPNKMYGNPTELLAAIKSESYDMAKQDHFMSKYVYCESDDIIGDIVSFIWNNI